MTERLSDDTVEAWLNIVDPDTTLGAIVREVQQWRALIPEVIEQLEAVRRDNHTSDLDAIIDKLREASQ